MALFRSKPKYPNLQKEKIDLIDYAFSTFNFQSFADLGGVWGVEGGYTFQTLEKYNIKKAVLVDTHPNDAVHKRAKKSPCLNVVEGNFGDKQTAKEVGEVDAIFLFDVLLHQVDPDWDAILEMYAPQTKAFVIFNQQWTGPGQKVRLLDLGEKEYFRNVPHNANAAPYIGLFQKLEEKHPDHNRKWKDVHHIWQWGITDSDLFAKIESLGFTLQYMKNCGGVASLRNFQNHEFIFTKSVISN